MKILQQPIKVIDDFFEAPLLWRHFALNQAYAKDPNLSWPGVRTAALNELNMNLFNSVAEKLIKHIHDRTYFKFLKVNFASVDGSYTKGWLHRDEPMYNVGGVIFLNPEPPKGSGLGFYTPTQDIDFKFGEYFAKDLTGTPEERLELVKYKDEQRAMYKRNMYVENAFNRCVMFPPYMWHTAEQYFGDDLETSRLAITFFGIAA